MQTACITILGLDSSPQAPDQVEFIRVWLALPETTREAIMVRVEAGWNVLAAFERTFEEADGRTENAQLTFARLMMRLCQTAEVIAQYLWPSPGYKYRLRYFPLGASSRTSCALIFSNNFHVSLFILGRPYHVLVGSSGMVFANRNDNVPMTSRMCCGAVARCAFRYRAATGPIWRAAAVRLSEAVRPLITPAR
jgi:hypothetical protein